MKIPFLHIDGEDNPIKEYWDKLAGKPGGKLLFSKMLGMAAPYTGTINARVEDLRVGHARVSLRDRRFVRNHLRSVHAIALANLAEVTGNVALAYSLPSDARFIPTQIHIEYLKKARGTITGISDCPVPDSSERGEYLVPVSLRNEAGEEVARATLTTLVGPKRSADPAQ